MQTFRYGLTQHPTKLAELTEDLAPLARHGECVPIRGAKQRVVSQPQVTQLGPRATVQGLGQRVRRAREQHYAELSMQLDQHLQPVATTRAVELHGPSRDANMLADRQNASSC